MHHLRPQNTDRRIGLHGSDHHRHGFGFRALVGIIDKKIRAAGVRDAVVVTETETAVLGSLDDTYGRHPRERISQNADGIVF